MKKSHILENADIVRSRTAVSQTASPYQGVLLFCSCACGIVHFGGYNDTNSDMTSTAVTLQLTITRWTVHGTGGFILIPHSLQAQERLPVLLHTHSSRTISPVGSLGPPNPSPLALCSSVGLAYHVVGHSTRHRAVGYSCDLRAGIGQGVGGRGGQSTCSVSEGDLAASDRAAF